MNKTRKVAVRKHRMKARKDEAKQKAARLSPPAPAAPAPRPRPAPAARPTPESAG